MEFVQNFPFFSILLSLFSGTVTSMLNGKWAKRVNGFVISAVMVMSAAVLFFVLKTRECFYNCIILHQLVVVVNDDWFIRGTMI